MQNLESQLAHGVAALAEAQADSKLSGAIKQATAAGVSIFSILVALAQHAGDLAAIYQAIMDLINKVKPTPAA